MTAEVTFICIAGETATSAIAEHMELHCLQKASVATLQCVASTSSGEAVLAMLLSETHCLTLTVRDFKAYLTMLNI